MKVAHGEIHYRQKGTSGAKVICIFLILSFFCLTSLLFADYKSVFVPIVYVAYILITSYFLIVTKTDILSPLHFFILFSWLGFGLKYVWMLHDPSIAFFTRGYTYNFLYSTDRLFFSFFIFIIGYTCFLFSFNFMKGHVIFKKRRAPSTPYPATLAIAALFMIVISFLIRNALNIALPGIEPSGSYVGLISYSIRYLTLFLLGFLLFSSLEMKSILFTFISLILFLCQGVAELLFSWRGPLYTLVLIIIIIVYYVSRYRSLSFDRIFIYLTASMILLIVLFSLFVYPAIMPYRSSVIERGGTDFTSLVNSIRSGESGFSESIQSIFIRFIGIDSLHSVISYFDNEYHDSITNEFFLLRGKNRDITPVQYYTWYILGGSPQVISANAPSSWGSFYMYGGLLGIILFFLVAGSSCKILYSTIIANIGMDGRLIVYYAIFMGVLFKGIMDGLSILSLIQSAIALTAVYFVLIMVFDSLKKNPANSNERALNEPL